MTEITTEELRGVARSIRRVVQPTTTIDLLDVAYTLRRESRPRKADRDYAVLKALATGRRCVLDVGANLGLTALLMATTMAPDGRLFAFETSEQACRIIGDNAALNGLADRIVVVNALIAERSGLTIDFYGDFSSGGASIIPGYLAHDRPLRKATMALDDFVADCGCAPDLLKIDVEGAELRVLEGLTQTMAVHRPLLFVELHSWGDVTVSSTVARLLEQLAPLAYRLIYLRHKAIVDDPAVFAKRGRCHVLLCPNESSFFEELATLDTTGL